MDEKKQDEQSDVMGAKMLMPPGPGYDYDSERLNLAMQALDFAMSLLKQHYCYPTRYYQAQAKPTDDGRRTVGVQMDVGEDTERTE